MDSAKGAVLMDLNIGVIVSSTRPNRVGRKVADWFMEQVQDTPGINFELIDLAEEDLPFLNEPKSPAKGEYEHEHSKRWSAKIDKLDGFVFVTAEYNNGPPAPLKNAIDSIYSEWGKKPVAFVGYGTVGAARAIEQLVCVAAKINMVPITSTVIAITKAWEAIGEDGAIKQELVIGNIPKMIENLRWWTEATKSAKQKM